MKKWEIFLILLVGMMIGMATTTSAQESSSLEEAKNAYRARQRAVFETREQTANASLTALPTTDELIISCKNAKNTYRAAEKELSAIDTIITTNEGDKAYQHDLKQLRAKQETLIATSKIKASGTGTQIQQRRELVIQLAAIKKERAALEAKRVREDRPSEQSAYMTAPYYPGEREESSRTSIRRGGWGDLSGSYQPPPPLPWEFSVCFPDESIKEPPVNEGTSKVGKIVPTIRTVYFIPKGGVQPDLNLLRRRMEQARDWFRSKGIGTFDFSVSTKTGTKNASYYQEDVWGRVTGELGLTCDNEAQGVSIIIVPSSFKFSDAIGLGRHCGVDYSAGFSGHAMIPINILKDEYGLSTLIHEMGHAFSLPHVPDDGRPTLMCENGGPQFVSQAILLQEEVAALRQSPYFHQ
jgi:hypothetical protein